MEVWIRLLMIMMVLLIEYYDKALNKIANFTDNISNNGISGNIGTPVSLLNIFAFVSAIFSNYPHAESIWTTTTDVCLCLKGFPDR